MRFAVPHQWEAGNGDLRVVFRLQGDRLVGRMTFPDNATMNWQGVRAPRLVRPHPPRWGAPITLLDQNDLNGWQPMGASNQWVVRNGVLTSPRSGVNLRTARTFGDFKLHIEFRYPKRSNSGVYLRGRYEVQIETRSERQPTPGQHLVPTRQIALRPNGRYDITPSAARRWWPNGAGDLQPGDSRHHGGAMDSNEGAPGPLSAGRSWAGRDRNIVLTQPSDADRSFGHFNRGIDAVRSGSGFDGHRRHFYGLRHDSFRHLDLHQDE